MSSSVSDSERDWYTAFTTAALLDNAAHPLWSQVRRCADIYLETIDAVASPQRAVRDADINAALAAAGLGDVFRPLSMIAELYGGVSEQFFDESLADAQAANPSTAPAEGVSVVFLDEYTFTSTLPAGWDRRKTEARCAVCGVVTRTYCDGEAHHLTAGTRRGCWGAVFEYLGEQMGGGPVLPFPRLRALMDAAVHGTPPGPAHPDTYRLVGGAPSGNS